MRGRRRSKLQQMLDRLRAGETFTATKVATQPRALAENPDLASEIDAIRRARACPVFRDTLPQGCYLIQCDTTGLVKIGFSNDPNDRLRTLRIGSPTKRAAAARAARAERHVQNRLNAAARSIQRVSARVGLHVAHLRSWVIADGHARYTQKELAALCGVTQATISAWVRDAGVKARKAHFFDRAAFLASVFDA